MRRLARSLRSNGHRWKPFAAALLVALLASCSDKVTAPTAIVDGVVHLRDGPALPGLVVSFFEPATSQAVHAALSAKTPPLVPYVTTDANGRFSLLVPAGTYEVWVGGPADSGVVSLQVSTVTVEGSRASLDLHYPGYRVRGEMRSLNVALAAGSVFVQDGIHNARADLRDNGDGPHEPRTYSLLMPAGTWDFWANPYEGYWGVPRVKFEGIAVSSDTTIDLACDGHFVQGHVTGPDGSVVYGAVVSATSANASAWNYTDSNGFYGLHLPTGGYRFLVTPPPGADTLGALGTPDSVIIDAPQTIDFKLPPPIQPPGP